MSPYSSAFTVRVPKASELVADHLRRQIVLGELQAGDWLPVEAVLLRQYGVSRPTLREAYRILENESIVSVKRGAKGGARVLVPDPSVAAHHAGVLLQYQGTLVADVYDARAMIESSAVAELARTRTSADLARLDAAVEAMRSVLDDALATVEQDVRFHRLLVELAGNSTVELLVGMLYEVIATHTRSYLAVHDHAAELPAAGVALRSQRKLVSLLRAKDAEGARTYWRKYLAGVKTYMIKDPSTTVVEILS